MPKLPKERQDGANAQEPQGEYKPIKPGKYVMRLTEVEEGETGPDSTNPGTPKWVWKLQVDKDYHPELRKGGPWSTSFFEHVPITEKMDWKMRQLFEAFGYTVDSDTDEIIEDADARCVAIVGRGKNRRTDEDEAQVKRYIAFDPSKFTFSPEDEDDDNQ